MMEIIGSGRHPPDSGSSECQDFRSVTEEGDEMHGTDGPEGNEKLCVHQWNIELMSPCFKTHTFYFRVIQFDSATLARRNPAVVQYL